MDEKKTEKMITVDAVKIKALISKSAMPHMTQISKWILNKDQEYYLGYALSRKQMPEDELNTLCAFLRVEPKEVIVVPKTAPKSDVPAAAATTANSDYISLGFEALLDELQKTNSLLQQSNELLTRELNEVKDRLSNIERNIFNPRAEEMQKIAADVADIRRAVDVSCESGANR